MMDNERTPLELAQGRILALLDTNAPAAEVIRAVSIAINIATHDAYERAAKVAEQYTGGPLVVNIIADEIRALKGDTT